MKELDVVKLIQNYNSLSKDTYGVVVHMYNSEMFEVEYFDSLGKTIDVITTPADILQLVQSKK